MPFPEGVTSEGLRAEFRAEEAEADERKWGIACLSSTRTR
jgi:hypothetical protein